MRYTREDGCRAWLTTGHLPLKLLRALMKEWGTAEHIYDSFCAGDEALMEQLKERRVILKERAERSAMHSLLRAMQEADMGILYLEDYAYPELLRTLDDAPVLLYYRGSLECLQGRCLTIIGTRKASLLGRETAQEIAAELARNGVCVVSGMAYGIDSAAHRGCVEAGGCSCAVLACGLDVDYPRENAELKRQLLRGGGVMLSEYPPGVRADASHFEMRNRILSGLSRGTLMVECRERSGSMITVRHALEQGRDVFVWPGIPGSVNAEGAHILLRDGGRIVNCARDILEDLSWLSNPAPTREQLASLPAMTPEQKQLYLILQRGSSSMDELAMETGMETPKLVTALSMLQLAGLVRAEPGKRYSVI